MTVIFDGKTIASDSLRQGNEDQKIFKVNSQLGEVLVGIEGTPKDVQTFIKYLENEDPEIPEMSIDFEALLVNADSETELFGNGVFHYKARKTTNAIGSGKQFALAASHCGKTAAEAIEVAKALDLCTVGPIQVAHLVDPQVYGIMQMMALGNHIGSMIGDCNER